MKSNIRLAVLVIPAVLMLSEALHAQQTETVTLPDELQLVLSNYETYWKSSDAKALSMLFTEDGFILRPGNTPTRGRAFIEEAYQNSGGDLKLRAYDFQIESNLAFIIGGYTYGNRTEDVGKFTLILKREENRWLIHSDMDNGNS